MIKKQLEEEEDAQYYQAKDNIQVGHWVLVRFETKLKKNVCFVGQVVKISDIGDPEVIFLRHHKSDKHGTTFLWPPLRDITEIPSTDIITVLPEPDLGRRGELMFPVSFASYKLQ